MAAASGPAILLLALVVLSLCSLQGAQAATDCISELTGLAGCQAYLTNTSSTPDQKTCCTPLNTVLTTPSSFQCLCAQVSSSSSSSSSSSDIKNALGLPKRCKLSINVSEANCTTTSTSNSTSSPSSSDNAGFMTASPSLYLFISALFVVVVSLFA